LLFGALDPTQTPGAAVGLYGTVSYSVTRRRREIAVRLALGATTERVFGDVVVQSFIIGGAGILGGIVVSALATRALASMLFAVSPLDAVTYAGAAAVLLAIVACATAVPAWRASSIDPALTLRAE
jgi:putative ABC transport system permease protein